MLKLSNKSIAGNSKHSPDGRGEERVRGEQGKGLFVFTALYARSSRRAPSFRVTVLILPSSTNSFPVAPLARHNRETS